MRRIYTTLWISGVNGSFRIMPNSCLSQKPNLMFFFKSTWRRLSLLSFIHSYVCGLFCGFVRDLLTEGKTIQTLNLLHTLPLTISKNKFFVFFRKNWPWGSLAMKNCRVTWIFCITPRLPCFYLLPFMPWGLNVCFIIISNEIAINFS